MVPTTRAGRYLVFDEIAAGGTASVHLGRLDGPVGFGRTVAIKKLHRHLANEPDFVAMLLDEARIASRIHHTNVVQTLDIVVEDDLALVLEYVHGDSVARLSRRVAARGERIDPAIASAIAVGVLRGLHAAHETRGEGGENLGIIHRDVSPQNVLVGLDGVARILDFGIAKASGRIQTTRDGQIKGKLAYMPPEQIRGRAVDRRVDVYAAAVLLWELLAGRRLFQADDDGALLARVLEGVVLPPSAVAPSVSVAADEVVLRALARDPAARFSTAAAMADALEEALPPAPTSRVAAWVAAEWPEAEARRRRIAELEDTTARAVVREVARDDRTESALAVVPLEPLAPPASSSPERPRRRSAWGLAFALSGAVAAGALLAFVARRQPVAVAAVAATADTRGDASAPSAADDPTAEIASESALAAPQASAKSLPPRSRPTTKTKRDQGCERLYDLDKNGSRVWRRECFK